MSDTPENIPLSAQEIRGLVDRIVRMEEEKKAAADAIKGYLYGGRLQAAEQALELMLAALGDYVSTPLGEAATKTAR